MPTPPRTIAGRYRVLEEAGRGGMGSVWRCIDERLGREVAVKQVGRLPGESVTHQARALREARSSAALNHPNVVSVYDAIAEDDHLWLVMEYVPGRTLSQIVREDGPLPPGRIARIGAQVAGGLAAAHERGTVHRDVKPGNVLVQQGDLAKISDFGIARTAGDDTLTQTGMVSGTPAYFAPEIARGGDPTPASDVWALGATIFAAVEGRPPYGNNPNALALLSTIASEEPPAPEHAGPLTEPIRHMLARDPASRWSMTEVADALHRVQELGAAPADTHEEPTRAVTVPGAPTAGATATADTGSGDEPSAAPAPPRRRQGGLALLVAGLVSLLVLALGALLLLGEGPAETPVADEETSDTSPPPDRRTRGTRPDARTGAPSESPDEPTSSAPTEQSPAEPTETTAQAIAADSPSAFVEDYYAALPADTETGYSLLSPSYRADMSYGDYNGFWSTIEDVEVLDTERAGPNAVDVTLLYNGQEQEVRRIYLERGEPGWLIADDEVVG